MVLLVLLGVVLGLVLGVLLRGTSGGTKGGSAYRVQLPVLITKCEQNYIGHLCYFKSNRFAKKLKYFYSFLDKFQRDPRARS